MKEIFMGPDGKPSGRRIIGIVLSLVGAGLLIVAQIQPASGTDMWSVIRDLGPGALCLVVSATFWGIITADKIRAILGRSQGGACGHQD
jgi:drug/metabolite transporter (DMT)-like permease